MNKLWSFASWAINGRIVTGGRPWLCLSVNHMSIAQLYMYVCSLVVLKRFLKRETQQKLVGNKKKERKISRLYNYTALDRFAYEKRLAERTQRFHR